MGKGDFGIGHAQGRAGGQAAPPRQIQRLPHAGKKTVNKCTRLFAIDEFFFFVQHTERNLSGFH